MAKHPHNTPVLIRAIIDNSEGNQNKLTESDIEALKEFLRDNWNNGDDKLFQLIVDTFNDLYHEWKDEMVQIAIEKLKEPEDVSPTQGKWEVEFCLDQSIFINAGENPIAMMQSEEDEGITPEMEANAKLIAAAPEMLEVLRKCVPYLEQLQRHNTEMNPNGWDEDKELTVLISESEVAIQSAIKS